MRIFNSNQIRSKWHNVFFKYHGMRRVLNSFDTDSLEVLIFENLLANFSKHRKINNKYGIMYSVDYDYYEKNIHSSIISLMSILKKCPENIDYNIIYQDQKVFIILL